MIIMFLFLSFFLLNSEFAIIDFLPDIAALFYLYFKIRPFSYVSEKVMTAFRYLTALIIADALKLLSLRFAFSSDSITVTLFTFIFVLIKVPLFYLILKYLRTGLESILENETEMNYRLSLGLCRFSFVLYVLKNVFSLIPELTSLQSDNSVINSPGYVPLSNFKGVIYFVLTCIYIAVFAVYLIHYLRRLKLFSGYVLPLRKIKVGIIKENINYKRQHFYKLFFSVMFAVTLCFFSYSADGWPVIPVIIPCILLSALSLGNEMKGKCTILSLLSLFLGIAEVILFNVIKTDKVSYLILALVNILLYILLYSAVKKLYSSALDSLDSVTENRFISSYVTDLNIREEAEAFSLKMKKNIKRTITALFFLILNIMLLPLVYYECNYSKIITSLFVTYDKIYSYIYIGYSLVGIILYIVCIVLVSGTLKLYSSKVRNTPRI